MYRTANNIKAVPSKKEGPYLFYGLILYTILFYVQPAGRISALGPLRLEFAIGLLMVLWSVIKIIKGEIKFQENSLNTAAILFLLVALITIPFSLWRSHALDTFIRFFKFFSIYLMIIAAISNEEQLKIFFYVYVLMNVFLVVEPFFLSIQGKGFIYNNHMYRLAGPSGYFGHPNQLGGMTAANLPFLYYLAKYEKSKIRKIIYIALIAISARVIMLTLSRTAFVGLLAFLFFVWLYSKKKAISLILIVIACIVLWNFAPQETKDRFLTFQETSEVLSGEQTVGSMAGRWTLVKNAFLVFLDNPIIGVGLDNFKTASGRTWHIWLPPHNTYLQALAEMGLLGFIAFIAVIIITFKNLNKAKSAMKITKADTTLLYYITDAVILFLLLRCIVCSFGQELYDYYWWVPAGLSLVLLRVVRSNAALLKTA